VDITVFLGAPGSGKGTQAKILAKGHGYQHLSTGDMLRAAIQAGTELGKKAEGVIHAGNLVPDSIMIELIQRTLAHLDGNSNVILDGFPRTVAQGEALDESRATRVDRAVYFELPMPLLVQRLTGRRICEKCGQPFHILFVPPKDENICDLCGGALLQRPDDTEDVVKRRLEVFSSQTQPLLDFFTRSGRLVKINGDMEVSLLQTTLGRVLGS
jgi:adenylate kinase